MTEPKEEPTASEELREAVSHLVSAARKVAKGAEPTVQRSLEEAERALDRVGREGCLLYTSPSPRD